MMQNDCANKACPNTSNTQQPVIMLSIIDRRYRWSTIRDFCSWQCVAAYAATRSGTDAESIANAIREMAANER